MLTLTCVPLGYLSSDEITYAHGKSQVQLCACEYFYAFEQNRLICHVGQNSEHIDDIDHRVQFCVHRYIIHGGVSLCDKEILHQQKQFVRNRKYVLFGTGTIKVHKHVLVFYTPAHCTV